MIGVPLRVYAANALVSVVLNVLLALALGHPLGSILSVTLGLLVGSLLTWSYLRRSDAAARAGRRP